MKENGACVRLRLDFIPTNYYFVLDTMLRLHLLKSLQIFNTALECVIVDMPIEMTLATRIIPELDLVLRAFMLIDLH